MQLRVADLIRDADLAPAVYKIARQLLETTAEQMSGEPGADPLSPVEQIIRRWIGASARFGNV
jgi:hypothetical protein